MPYCTKDIFRSLLLIEYLKAHEKEHGLVFILLQMVKSCALPPDLSFVAVGDSCILGTVVLDFFPVASEIQQARGFTVNSLLYAFISALPRAVKD